jgi:hypothetical protein
MKKILIGLLIFSGLPLIAMDDENEKNNILIKVVIVDGFRRAAWNNSEDPVAYTKDMLDNSPYFTSSQRSFCKNFLDSDKVRPKVEAYQHVREEYQRQENLRRENPR